MKKYMIGLLVTNKYGVLTRIASLFARRGYNIDTLTVGETVNPQVSRMTIMITGNDRDRDQMIKQLRKLHDVHFVKEMVAEKSVCRELVLLKVATDRFFVCGGRKKTDIAEEKGASPTAFDRICKEEMVSL